MMNYMENGFPVPSDYFGVLWALAGIKNAKVVEHGSTGTVAYNTVNFGILNRLKPKGKLFSSGLDEDDVVMGGEEKLVSAIKEVDRLYRPKLLSVVATGVTSVIGLDLNGIADDLRKDIQAKMLVFPGGGFRGSYTDGIEEVFGSLAGEVVRDSGKMDNRAVNLLGVTVDSFNHMSDLLEIRRLLGILGIRVNTVFTQNTEVEAIETMSQAGLNLVLGDTGREAAKIIKQRFGTPWLYGMPFGIRGTVKWLKDIAQMTGVKLDKAAIANEIKDYGQTMSVFTSFMKPFNRLRIGISGSNEYVRGLAEFLINECEMDVRLAVIQPSGSQERIASELLQTGVGEVLTEPDVSSLRNSIENNSLHIFFGNAYELKIASKVPVKIHSAFPSFDYLNFHDGTPFVGFKGDGYIIQTLVNNVNQHPEVWRI